MHECKKVTHTANLPDTDWYSHFTLIVEGTHAASLAHAANLLESHNLHVVTYLNGGKDNVTSAIRLPTQPLHSHFTWIVGTHAVMHTATPICSGGDDPCSHPHSDFIWMVVGTVFSMQKGYQLIYTEECSEFTWYRLGTVNSNMVNSKFHLIQSFFEIFARFLSFHV